MWKKCGRKCLTTINRSWSDNLLVYAIWNVQSCHSLWPEFFILFHNFFWGCFIKLTIYLLDHDLFTFLFFLLLIIFSGSFHEKPILLFFLFLLVALLSFFYCLLNHFCFLLLFPLYNQRLILIFLNPFLSLFFNSWFLDFLFLNFDFLGIFLLFLRVYDSGFPLIKISCIALLNLVNKILFLLVLLAENDTWVHLVDFLLRFGWEHPHGL